MSDSPIRSQTVPSLVSTPLSTSSDETSVSILSGLSDGGERRRKRSPLWPVPLALALAISVAIAWWQGLPDMVLGAEVPPDAGGAAVSAPVAASLSQGVAPVSDLVVPSPSDVAVAVEPVVADALPAVAVIEEVPPQIPTPEAVGGLAPDGPSAAVEIGLVSPEAAEPKQVAVTRLPKQTRKAMPAPQKTARRAAPVSADADVDIITAIVKGASSR